MAKGQEPKTGLLLARSLFLTSGEHVVTQRCCFLSGHSDMAGAQIAVFVAEPQ